MAETQLADGEPMTDPTAPRQGEPQADELCQNCGRKQIEHWAVKNLADAPTLICPTGIWRRMASSPLVPLSVEEVDADD